MSKGKIIVLKFGGSSVANAERLLRVAEIVTAKHREGYAVVVVVSAQGDTTDELLAKAKGWGLSIGISSSTGTIWTGRTPRTISPSSLRTPGPSTSASPSWPAAEWTSTR